MIIYKCYTVSYAVIVRTNISLYYGKKNRSESWLINQSAQMTLL